jgi:tetratricopeptide (TPR) repeat protein
LRMHLRLAKISNSTLLAVIILVSSNFVACADTSWNKMIDEGNRFELLKNYTEAKKAYANALGKARKDAVDTPQVCVSEARLAAVCVAQKDLKEAAIHTQNALAIAIQEKASGHPNKQVLTSLDDLAGVYLDKSPTVNQEACYKTAIEIREKVFGVSHPNLARTYGTLAVLDIDDDRFADASPLINKALNKSLSSDKYSLVENILNHAILKYKHGDLIAALYMCRIVADIERKTASDRYTSMREQFEAILFSDKGQFSKAENLFLDVIKYDRVHHPGGKRLANDYAQLARFYCLHHLQAEALKSFGLARTAAAKARAKNLSDEIASDQNHCIHNSGIVMLAPDLRFDH